VLLLQLADHLNAEVVAGTITCRQDALDYLTWTYFYRYALQARRSQGLNCREARVVKNYCLQGRCLTNPN
jgi:activating signal cointegrator complex subunit 3